MTHVLTGRTYVNADRSKVVEEGAVDAAYLLGDKGDEVTDEVASSLGLGGSNSIDDMTKAELMEYAEAHGIEVDAKASKSDIKDAIVASSEPD